MIYGPGASQQYSAKHQNQLPLIRTESHDSKMKDRYGALAQTSGQPLRNSYKISNSQGANAVQ